MIIRVGHKFANLSLYSFLSFFKRNVFFFHVTTDCLLNPIFPIFFNLLVHYCHALAVRKFSENLQSVELAACLILCQSISPKLSFTTSIRKVSKLGVSQWIVQRARDNESFPIFLPFLSFDQDASSSQVYTILPNFRDAVNHYMNRCVLQFGIKPQTKWNSQTVNRDLRNISVHPRLLCSIINI